MSLRNPNMIKWAKDLFPYPRSLTGFGNRKTLQYIQKVIGKIKIVKFSSNKKVFDWTIPLEWEIKDAYIQHSSGQKFASFKKHNLHIVGYSQKINKNLKLSDLKNNIHFDPKDSDAIPYVTSYYKKNWGFCMSKNEINKMPKGNYKAFIDAEFKKGFLEVGEFFIKGKSKKEILFCCNICHPSMVNNELSGMVVMMALIKFIRKQHKNSYYSYKFLFLPETIGSIAYLSKYYKQLKQNVIAGYQLSCVGDERSFSHISSRLGSTLADLSVISAIKNKKNYKSYDFLSRGSDERQFCSPGIDLPFCGFSKTKYGEFPEYHTSKDDFNLVTQKGLLESYEVFQSIINSFERGIYTIVKSLGEPFMSKYNLYPTISKKDQYKNIENIMNVLAYSDGLNNIFQISLKCNISLNEINSIISTLKENNIIKVRYI